jgi:hypothetical protein
VNETKLINAVLYLLEEMNKRADEIREELDNKPLSLGKAYLQGKADAYAYVLLTLREALEREEAKDNG